MDRPDGQRIPLLLLVSDTGGGHRSAAEAVAQAFERQYAGRFAPAICDPLRGPAASPRLRYLVGLYGPTIRMTPWLWGMLWRSCNAPRRLALTRRTLLRPAYRSLAAVVEMHKPTAIIAFHPFIAEPAVRARNRCAPGALMITVVTDLVTAHLSWRDAAVDRIVVPSTPLRHRSRLDGLAEDQVAEIGLPVGAEFARPPARLAERRALRAKLGLREDRFLAVLTGGAEGSGGIYRRAAALIRRTDVDVAVICGRNAVLRRRLARLAACVDGRLTVRGFVTNMADWLRCADVVVGKAGPGTIAEAACCAAPLLLTSYLPGQEEGNVQFVVNSGAGRYAPRVRDLVAHVNWLRQNPEALGEMRMASAAISRPEAAADIAKFVAGLLGVKSPGQAGPDDPVAAR